MGAFLEEYLAILIFSKLNSAVQTTEPAVQQSHSSSLNYSCSTDVLQLCSAPVHQFSNSCTASPQKDV